MIADRVMKRPMGLFAGQSKYDPVWQGFERAPDTLGKSPPVQGSAVTAPRPTLRAARQQVGSLPVPCLSSDAAQTFE